MANKNQQRGVQHAKDRNDKANANANANVNDQWEPENSRGPRGYGHSQAYGGPLGYQDETLRSPRVDPTTPKRK